jgi:hypothetical protein
MTRQSSHKTLFAMILAASALLGGCAPPHLAPHFESAEEAEDFRETLQSNGRAVAGLLQKAEAGENVSSLSLGWLVYNILTLASGRDEALYRRLDAGGRDIQVYLKTQFRTQPEEEIAALDAMVAEEETGLRLVARSALESLRHIPDLKDTPETQRRDRAELAKALRQLHDALERAAGEVELP